MTPNYADCFLIVAAVTSFNSRASSTLEGNPQITQIAQISFRSWRADGARLAFGRRQASQGHPPITPIAPITSWILAEIPMQLATWR
jgi:hypothetical protein